MNTGQENTSNIKNVATKKKLPKSKRGLLLRLVRGCIYCLLFLILFSGASLLGFQWYLSENGPDVSQKIEEYLEERTGVNIRFSAVNIEFFPLPTLRLSQVLVQKDTLNVSVAHVRLAPSLRRLLLGDINFGLVHLVQPKISAQLNHSTPSTAQSAPLDSSTAHDELLQAIQTFLEYPLVTWPEMFLGINLRLEQASLALYRGKESLDVQNFSAHIDINLNGSMTSTFDFTDISLKSGQDILVAMPEFSFSLQGLGKESKKLLENFSLSKKAQAENLSLVMHSVVHVPEVLHNVEFDLALNVNPYILESSQAFSQAVGDIGTKHVAKIWQPIFGTWSVKGDILWKKAAIPFAIKSFMQMGPKNDADGRMLDLQGEFSDMRVHLHNDKAVVNANLEDIIENPTIQGRAQLEKFSLTQWFGFARNFPPGLQATLDTITGQLDFSLDSKGLRVPKIEAEAAQSTFKGHGGVQSWKDIVIALHLTAPKVWLKLAYPEAEGIKSKAPQYHHEALTPVPGTPEARSMTGPTVGYDINIAADTVVAWDLTLQDLDMRIIPIEEDKRYKPQDYQDGVLLTFNLNKVYGGKGRGDVILYRTKKDESGYAIIASMDNMRAEKPLARLLGSEMVGGKLFAKTSFKATGRGLGEFLITKVGTASVRIVDGYFAGKTKGKWHFDAVNVRGNFAAKNKVKVTGDTLPPTLRYMGSWNGDITSKYIDIKGTWNGPLEFAGQQYGNVIIDNMDSKAHVVVRKDFANTVKDIHADVQAFLNVETYKNVVTIEKAQGKIINIENAPLEGDLRVDFVDDIIWTARVKILTDKASAFYGGLRGDPEFLPLKGPQDLQFISTVVFVNEDLTLKDLQVKLGSIEATGTIHKKLSAKPVWQIDLDIPKLDWHVLYPPDSKEKDRAAIGKQRALGNDKVWDLAWMDEQDVYGEVRIKSFLMSEEYAKDVTIPIVLKESSLICDPVLFNFFGSNAHIQLKTVRKGQFLQLQGGIGAKNIDLAALSKRLKLKTLFGGQGLLLGSMEGNVQKTSDIPATLDGTWRMEVKNSFLQEINTDGSAAEDPTHIELFTASGTMTKGILASKNFLLKGPNLHLQGGGQINLVKNTLDLKLNANMGSMSNIPVHFYGSFDNPKRSVSTGAVILSALGSFGTGILDVIGGFFGAFFSIFN